MGRDSKEAPQVSGRYRLLHCGVFVRSHDTIRGAKIAVAMKARRHRSFSYQAVDVVSGEIWQWDPRKWKLEKLESKYACHQQT